MGEEGSRNDAISRRRDLPRQLRELTRRQFFVIVTGIVIVRIQASSFPLLNLFTRLRFVLPSLLPLCPPLFSIVTFIQHRTSHTDGPADDRVRRPAAPCASQTRSHFFRSWRHRIAAARSSRDEDGNRHGRKKEGRCKDLGD